MLKTFIYLLLRDHMSFGTMEEVMEIVESTKGKTVTREDDNMDKYVASLAERLKDE